MKKKSEIHESIKTKQEGVSLDYSDYKPSEVTDVYLQIDGQPLCSKGNP